MTCPPSPFRSPRASSRAPRWVLDEEPQRGGDQARAGLLTLGQRVADQVGRSLATPAGRLAQLEALLRSHRDGSLRRPLTHDELQLVERSLHRLRVDLWRREGGPTPIPSGNPSGDAA